MRQSYWNNRRENTRIKIPIRWSNDERIEQWELT
jgi:hypothetical protein